MASKTKRAQRKPRGKKPRRIDPVVTEIVRNGVIAVTEEMKTNLMRTAYNIIIYEALDFTTGLFTPQGETVSIGIGLPMFIRGMSDTVKTKSVSGATVSDSPQPATTTAGSTPLT